MVKIVCDYCQKDFYRPQSRINEATKRGWKQFCSPTCLGKGKNKQSNFVCQNPSCQKSILRSPHQISKSGNVFCSQSCAAVVNNSVFPRKEAEIYHCLTCKTTVSSRRKYCSPNCTPKRIKTTDEQIIKAIQLFYSQHKRVPYREEFLHTKAARIHFGSWNKTIEASGYQPNPVKFSQKHVAEDGHICDSLAEKIIDDWLSLKGITHQRSVRYPFSKQTVDFKIGNFYVEFFGLEGKLKIYDKAKEKKLKLIKDHKLQFIAIHPYDLFPRSNLETLFKGFVF